MQELIFAEPTLSMQHEIESYRNEHFANGEHEIYGGAWMERVSRYTDWLQLVRANAHPQTVNPSWVPSSMFCVLRKEDNALIGMVDIHHRLNDFLRASGGHISYSVRPSKRNRGYGAQILHMALEFCAQQLSIEQVTVSCATNNYAAIATIEHNDAVPVREFQHANGRLMTEYRIDVAQHMKAYTRRQKSTLYPKFTLKNGVRASIRTVDVNDARSLLELFRSVERESFFVTREPDEHRITVEDTVNTIETVLDDAKRTWLVAEVDGRIVARCSVNRSRKGERFSHIAAVEIEVLRAYWNMGLGTMMIDYALGWADQNGYERVHIFLNASDERTLHVFQKFGFEIAGRLEEAYRYPDATYADMLMLSMKL